MTTPGEDRLREADKEERGHAKRCYLYQRRELEGSHREVHSWKHWGSERSQHFKAHHLRKQYSRRLQA